MSSKPATTHPRAAAPEAGAAAPAPLERRATAAPTPWDLVPRGVVVALCLLTAVVLELYRSPDFTRNVIWAEDGGVFLSDAYNESFFTAVGHPYGSYLAVVPRVVMEVVSWFPVAWASVLIAAISSALVALVALYVFHASGAVLRTRWARLALAALVVLLPQGGYETNATMINVHWYLIYAGFWTFVSAPRSTRGIALGSAIVAAAALSDPLAGLLLPVAAVGIVRDRDRRSLVVPAVLVAALVVQFAVGTSQQPLGHATVALTDLPSIYALRVAGSLLVGDVFLDNFWLSLGHAFLYGAILAVLAVGALGVTRGRRSSRVFVAGTLALSFLTMAAPLIIRGTCCFLDRAAFNLNGSRYFVVPVLLLAAAVLKVLDEGLSAPAPAPRRRARWQAAQLAVTLAGAGLLLVNYSVVNVRNAGPFWANSVREAQAVCSGARGTPPAVAALGVAPPLNPAPFAVKVPCGRLR